MYDENCIITLPVIDEIEINVFQEFMKTSYEIKQGYAVTERLVELAKEHFTFYAIRSEQTTELWVFSEGIYVPYGKSTLREFCRYMCGEKYRQSVSEEVIAKMEADTYIDSNIFFNKKIPNLIPVKNGLLNLETKMLEPFNSEYILFNKVPVVYDPTATCPAIHKFFMDIAASEKDIQTFYELFGYCLYKDSFIEKAVMLLGNGRNGKTKFLSLLRQMLGESNTSEISLNRIEVDKFSVHVMMNKLANLAGDISKKRIEDSSIFKELVGRDKISTARKFREDIEFESYAKQIFATNNLPQIDDSTDGFWTKWVLLSFPNKFVPIKEMSKVLRDTPVEKRQYIKEMNPHILRDIIKPSEMSGLLNKSLEGLQNLLEIKSFTSSQSSKDIERMWIRESSSFAAFAYDNIEKRANYYITSSEMASAYADYCDLTSLGIESPKDISHAMNSLFNSTKELKRMNEDTDRMWANVKFKNESGVTSNLKNTIFVSRLPIQRGDEDDGRQTILG